MASLAILPRPEPVSAPHPAFQSTPAAFSALEWSVVAMAQNDSVSSLRQAGPLTKRIGTLLGVWRPSELADERLEVLRRTAVLAWHRGYVIASSQLGEFLGAGFTLDHYELLQGHIGQERTRKRGSFQ